MCLVKRGVVWSLKRLLLANPGPGVGCDTSSPTVDVIFPCTPSKARLFAKFPRCLPPHQLPSSPPPLFSCLFAPLPSPPSKTRQTPKNPKPPNPAPSTQDRTPCQGSKFRPGASLARGEREVLRHARGEQGEGGFGLSVAQEYFRDGPLLVLTGDLYWALDKILIKKKA